MCEVTAQIRLAMDAANILGHRLFCGMIKRVSFCRVHNFTSFGHPAAALPAAVCSRQNLTAAACASSYVSRITGILRLPYFNSASQRCSTWVCPFRDQVGFLRVVGFWECTCRKTADISSADNRNPKVPIKGTGLTPFEAPWWLVCSVIGPVYQK